jgi:lipopolysaccharide transport protein LptA
MESPYMPARFVGGALASAEVLEGASFVETAAGGAEPLRKATSRRGQIVFEEGRAVAMSLASKVVLEEGKNRVFADQGIMDLRGKRATFEGQPVVATTERGELRSPRLTFQEASRIVLASGGVQCTLNPQGAALLARSGLASGSGPLRVDSAEASFQDGPRTAVFLGQVRAWRGSDVLVADQLRLDDATSTLTASGAVKTMWQAPGDPTAQGPAAEPVEIAADSLVYGAGKLTYQGTVIATQGARRLRCDEATIEVGEDKKVRRIVGRGRASLEEDSGRRKVTGDSLDYDLVEKRVTLRGAPVIVVDPVRGRAEGRLVVYDVATGAMRLSASAEPPAGAPDR